MGEPVIDLAPADAYRLWSSDYDTAANPVLALEMRVLRERLNPLAGCRLIDVATGTGRWAAYAGSQGAAVVGIDLSSSMLAVARQKPALRGRLAVADMRALPFPDHTADLAICSFALGYVESLTAAMAELARVARRVIVTDIHPLAIAAGWTRSFRSGAGVYRIRSYSHSLTSVDQAINSAGLEKRWEMEVRFGAPEEQLFRDAEKHELFIRAQQVPAIYARCWEAAI